MRPASDTARRDVSPLLGEAEGGEIGGVVAQSAGTRRCGILPRRHGGAGGYRVRHGYHSKLPQ